MIFISLLSCVNIICVLYNGRPLNKVSQCLYIKVHNIKRYRIPSLNDGWGMTDGYSWKEDTEFIYVTAPLSNDVTSNDLTVEIDKESLNVINKDSNNPLITGNTRGKIDLDGTFWTLEDRDGSKELLITIKKQKPVNNNGLELYSMKSYNIKTIMKN